jgi:hypothetical protein
MADQLYRQGVRDETELRDPLSITEETLKTYLADAKRDEKAAAKSKAWDLWLDCHSERGIAKETGTPHQTISDWLAEKRKDPIFGQVPPSRQHFDVWQFQKADGESSFFGRMPPQVVENLLWLYTKPGDIVDDKEIS